VFVENDVIPKRGWLEALLACADETAADVIVPLTCEGRPLHTIVHHVGPLEEPTPGADGSASGQRNYDETFHLQGQTREQVASKLIRRRTQTCEFHCVMMRRSLFNRIEPFDPLIVSKEHLDFSWRVTTADGAIWVEPGAVVTFLVPSASDPIRLTDLPYFLLRWSPHWQRRSHDSLKAKWGLQEAGYISSRRKLSGWRIVQHVVRPALERTPLLGRRWGFVERAAHLVYPAVAFAAAMLAWRYEARREHARDNERVSA
jgi:GT2 family glycosyltransferase